MGLSCFFVLTEYLNVCLAPCCTWSKFANRIKLEFLLVDSQMYTQEATNQICRNLLKQRITPALTHENNKDRKID